MLHLVALVVSALACPESTPGYVELSQAGPCLDAAQRMDAPSTLDVTSLCGPGRLVGPTGDETCDGCEVDVDVDDPTVVTLDVSTLSEIVGSVDLVYTFTPDEGEPEDLVVRVVGPDNHACPSSGCDHAGTGTSLGVLAVLGLLAARRRAPPG